MFHGMHRGRGGHIDDGRMRGEHPGRGRRGRVFDGGELRLVLLRLIADAPRHGYDLIREIEALTGGAYAPSPGVVYPTITLLGDMGLIVEAPSEGAKKLFAATEAGAAHLAEQAGQIEGLMARLRAIGEQRGRTDGGPVRRSMANLKMALHDRLGRADTSDETLHEVAALIDGVAQAIERLK